MNSLAGYGSDDNSEDSDQETFPELPRRPGLPAANKNCRKPAVHGDNYEEVGMDMSEDSNDSGGPNRADSSDRRANPYHEPELRPEKKGRSRSRSPRRKRDEDRRSNRNEDKRGRDGDRDRCRPPRRDDDKGRTKYRDDRRDRKDDRSGRDRRDRRRSRSRDRRRASKSPRGSSRSPRRSSRSPRSRSGSKDKTERGGGERKFASRKEKADKRMDRLDKLGIQFKPDNYPKSALEDAERNSQPGGNQFFMPGITGRFRDQIEKRKLLWQKAKEADNAPKAAGRGAPAPTPMAGGSKATKVYEATTFADDKTSNKFKRLMGIKETDASALPVKGTDVLKKQQEMFTSMEAQYEVARTATHTMRGVGLGFGSFQR